MEKFKIKLEELQNSVQESSIHEIREKLSHINDLFHEAEEEDQMCKFTKLLNGMQPGERVVVFNSELKHLFKEEQHVFLKNDIRSYGSREQLNKMLEKSMFPHLQCVGVIQCVVHTKLPSTDMLYHRVESIRMVDGEGDTENLFCATMLGEAQNDMSLIETVACISQIRKLSDFKQNQEAVVLQALEK